MMKLFLILAAISVFVAKINAGTVCAVGESDEAAGGYCNEPDENAGNSKCSEVCKKEYGKELLNSTCSTQRPNGGRECICSLKCANGGCWGDPHCHSFDNTQFGFQALRKYYVMKPINPFPNLPEFEIHQSNRPWGAGPMAIMHYVTLVIMDWGQVVLIKAPELAGQTFVVKVNGKEVPLPHRFSRFVEHREEFFDITWGDANKLNLVIKTSFGVIITLSNHPTGAVGPTSIYSDISVDLARHPEFRGNTGGILGRWNDDPKDDNIDSTGKPQPLDHQFSHAFGNSWLVEGGGVPSECEMELAKRKHEEHQKKFEQEHKERLTKLCKANFDDPEVNKCLKYFDRPPIVINNCVLDLSHIPDQPGQIAFLKAMVKQIDSLCPNIKLKFKDK